VRLRYPETASDSDWDGYARDAWQRADTLDPEVRAVTKLRIDALETLTGEPV
jgi:hypothetical protein